MGIEQIMLTVKRVLLVALFTTMTGCASVQTTQNDDPIQGINRAMFSFNESLDEVLLTPVAKGYKAVVPDMARQGVTNFFANLADIGNALNNLLQLKPDRAVNDLARVMVNSTIGLLGLVDVASNMQLPKHNEDFGQTMGVWGVGSGAYIVLPVLGASSVRDTIGTVVDWFTHPVSYMDESKTRWAVLGLALVDKRANLLGAEKVLEEAALDRYEFVRDGYQQRREYLIYDGNPPEEIIEE